ncbi:DNA adenine methylase, partial [Patescibacteria group bacterium]|nr:DNA adenine methylase [Patescibacteria group bacterium]
MINSLFNIESRRYTGSKAKLTDWIISLMKKYCKGDVFVDIFSGTGIITAATIKEKMFKSIIINDFLYSNYIIYDAFFSTRIINDKKLERIIAKYNSIDLKSIKPNYFSKNFGGKYFHKNTAKHIGYIRDDIEKKKKSLTKREYNVLLTALIYATDKAANTVGHYDAYIKHKPKDKRIVMKMLAQLPFKNIKIYKEDANILAKKLKADVVYIDPPYNSRQYSRFYHLLETLVKWDMPILYGTALKPATENSSDYCTVRAPQVFENLIRSINSKYIVVSYNNTYKSKSSSSKNKISLDEIEGILNNKGKTK